MFLMFCEYSVRKDPEVIILEVGLGGRYDATNLFDANLCALTSISRDHEQILGKGLANILSEKIEITRPMSTLLTTIETDFLKNIVKI